MNPTEHDTRAVRRFGITMAIAIPALFGLLLPLLPGAPLPLWPWAVGAAFLFLALALPSTLSPLERGWMRFGHVLGRINGRLLLTVVFFLVITPAGLLLRLLGKLSLARRPDPQLDSYRVASRTSGTGDMERPF